MDLGKTKTEADASGTVKVSVVVPVFRSAAFVERCVRSLMEQTLDDIEYIVINDCTPDDAMEIVARVINEYPEREGSVKLVSHTENKGIAYTRQEGNDLAIGEYIIHCDSDDWVDPGYYEALYAKAKAEDADIVSGNFVTERASDSFRSSSHWFADAQSFVDNRQFMFLSIWSHMIRRSFITDKGIRFYPGLNFSEDLAFLFTCYCHSLRNSAYDGDQLYYYNKLDNPNAQTAVTIDKVKLGQRAQSVKVIEETLRRLSLDGTRNGILIEEKRSIKEAYLQLPEPDFCLWHDTFPEMTRWLVRRPGMSKLCKIAWLLGQHVHPSILKIYTRISRISR